MKILHIVRVLLAFLAACDVKAASDPGSSEEVRNYHTGPRGSHGSSGRPEPPSGYSHFKVPLEGSYRIPPPLSPVSNLTPYSIFASARHHLHRGNPGNERPSSHGGRGRKVVSSIQPALLDFQESSRYSPSRKSFKPSRRPSKIAQNNFLFHPEPPRSSKPVHPFHAPRRGISQPPRDYSPGPNHVTPLRPFIVSPHHEVIIEEIREEHNLIVDDICRGYDLCMPIVKCAAFYDQLVYSTAPPCALDRGAYGVCCPPITGITGRPQGTFGPLRVDVPIRRISLDDINRAAEEALYQLKMRERLEKELQQKRVTVSDRNRPAYGHLQFFKTTVRAVTIARDALIVTLSSNSLVKRFELTPIEASFGLQKLNSKDSIIENTCPAPPTCTQKENFYRTIDGSCNNLANTEWGQARTPFQRAVPPQYSDGAYAPRVSKSGDPLPSARVVSLSHVVDADNPNPALTLSVMQWGQFIDHDLTHTPIFRFGNESGIECCDSNGRFVSTANTHPSCFPIEIPADDPFFMRFGRRCMNFVRSMPAPSSACTFGYTEQMNQVTHFLDGSAIYGSSTEEENDIRAHRGGLLKEQRNGLLPSDPHASSEECSLVGTPTDCFLAGDNRVNEQPDLAVMHTLWMRQHNRLAKELSRLNPHWTDETIYQEARRVVVAQMQHIVYNEWLPVVLGKECMLDNGLLPLRSGFSKDYDESLNPNILNEFATVAFRFGHTLVQGMIRLFDKRHQHSETITLHEHFNSPHYLYMKDKFDELLRGLVKQPMQSFDSFVSEELTNRLFQTPEMPFGMDLVALNIQRGRDHAVASYNELREVCGLPRATRFEDFRDTLMPDTIATLELLYQTVDDVDPFVAGISERAVEGALLGPTFKCLILDQFLRLKRGDRFFYENGGRPTSFTEAQLYEIRKTSWSGIICQNSNHIHKIQPLALRTQGPLNEKVSCDSPSIPSLNLTPWISAPYGQ